MIPVGGRPICAYRVVGWNAQEVGTTQNGDAALYGTHKIPGSPAKLANRKVEGTLVEAEADMHFDGETTQEVKIGTLEEVP